MTDFNTIYTNELKPFITDLDKKRITVERQLFTYNIVVGLICLLFILSFINNLAIVIIVLVIGSFLFSAGKDMIVHDYVQEFKEKIISALVTAINKDFTYNPTLAVPSFVFKKSQLFQSFDHYDGNDLIRGKIDDISFMFSELDVCKEISTHNGRSKVSIFQGIFAEFDFNKTFSSTVLIYPDVDEKYFGNIGKWIQKNRAEKANFTYLDHPEFEKHFVVYSDDPIETRYLLTHTMMNNIVKLREELKTSIYISFSHSKFYIAIEYDDKNFLEPILDNSLNKEELQKHFIVINQLTSIINKFKLHEYLWSKLSPKELHLKKEKMYQNSSFPKSKRKIESPLPRQNNDNQIFKDFYNNNALSLKKLERYRYISIFKTILFIISIISLYIIIIDVEPDFIAGIVVVLFGIIIGSSYITHGYQVRYNQDMVKTLIKTLHPNLIYKPYYGTKEELVYASKLFYSWDKFYSSNVIEGAIGKHSFHASELNFKVNKKKIFKGYFFVIDLPVAPQQSFRLFPRNNSYNVNPNHENSNWTHSKSSITNWFKHVFCIYSDDKVIISLLNEQFIYDLKAIRKDLNINEIFLSHNDDKLFLAFNFERTIFDVKITQSIYKDSDIQYFISFYLSVEYLLRNIE